MEVYVSKPFGPGIAKVKIPEKILNQLNDYVEKIILDKEKKNELDHGNNLVGDVTQELLIEKNIAKEIGWLDFLGQATYHYILSHTQKKIKEFNLIGTWVVRQFQNEYNPIHWHGGHVSGAGFLKVPSSFGDHLQDKPNKFYQGGNLSLVHGSKMFLSDPVFNILPEVGDFVLFPNYLMHTVYPFKNFNEERRSVSFNAFIDKDIYDVYS